MYLKGLIDCHTHCKFSPDGQDEPFELAQKAVERGLVAWALTDHCECNTWFEPEHYGIDSKTADSDDILMYNCRKFHQGSIEPVKSLAQTIDGKIEFVRGIELGQPLQAIEIANELISDKELDFVIGSLHNNADVPDFYYLQYDKMTDSELSKLLDDYFAQLLEMCEWGKFDILGHITYPLRYITGKYAISVDLGKYRDICAQIFKTLIAQGKGIEINTSSLFTDYKTTMPDKQLLALYKDLGGEVLSLGSDAHCAEKIGQGIDIGAQLAKECGFKYCTFFKRHKPDFVRL